MMLLVCFDLPRDTRIQRKEANRFRRRLLEYGFSMKQFSLYEREIKNSQSINKIIRVLCEKIPSEGEITLYLLPDYVNDSQINILGENITKYTIKKPVMIVL